MKCVRVLFGLAVVGFWGACSVAQAEGAEGKLKGVLFGDYYYIFSGANEKQNGFQVRRVYLTYDLTWNDRFSGRVRLEANDAGFGESEKMVPFVKHAYLRYRKGGRAAYFGLSGTPTWGVSERVWGYRSVEKTVMDLHKIGSSAGLGIAFEGKLDERGKASVHLMVGNGSGQSAEVDNGKKLYASLNLKPAGGLEASVYLDWEGKSQDRDRMTAAGFLGVSGKPFHGGVEAFARLNRNQAGGEDVWVRGASAFGAGPVRPQADLFARVDVYDPSDRGGDDVEILVIGGVDWSPAPDIHVMPNILATVFQAPGVDAEVIPRVTLFFVF